MKRGGSTIWGTTTVVSALELLLSRLADVPTPAGPTPVEPQKAATAQIAAAD